MMASGVPPILSGRTHSDHPSDPEFELRLSTIRHTSLSINDFSLNHPLEVEFCIPEIKGAMTGFK
jgi:hypothetical protein